MNNVMEQSFTVTYAMYDETPIACQGNDDQRKIRVITDCLTEKVDVHAEALSHSVALSQSCGAYVQVWDIQKRPRK